MDVGNVLSEAFALYRRHWLHLISIAFVVYLLVAVVTVLAALLGPLALIGAFFVALAGVFWLQGALVEAVQDVRDGRADLSIRETLARVRPRIGTIGVAGILATLGIVVGLLLFIVPGLVLLVFWSLLVPVIVLERASLFRAFGRSRELVRGNGWAVFGVIVITVLLLAITNSVITLVSAPLPDGVQGYVSNVLSNTLLAPFVALAWTLMYYHLRGEPPAPAGALAGGGGPGIPEHR